MQNHAPSIHLATNIKSKNHLYKNVFWITKFLVLTH